MRMKKLLLAVLSAAFCFSLAPQLFSEEPNQDKIIAIATAEVKAKGLKAEEAQVIYDEGGQRWCQTFGIATVEDTSPNHGIMKNGFLKNYRIILFDFKEPLKDVWVFVDKDTGEVLTVYQE
jgi:hypothetical protein